MLNLMRMKKSIATVCVLVLTTVLAVLVSTTQASNDAVTVLVYAPNSTDVVANLEEVATSQNEQIEFLFAYSWEAVQEQIESVTTLVVDGDTLTTVDADALRSTFIDSPLTVVGLDVEGNALASTLGVEHVYYAVSK